MGLAVIEDALESSGKKLTAYKVLMHFVYMSQLVPLLSTVVPGAMIITATVQPIGCFQSFAQKRSEIAYNTVHASSCLAFEVAL